MFDELAEELKEARIKNNLTLKQLSAKTRIDVKFLEAMEEGNFSFLPEIYVRAFLKEYAGVVELNPEIILKKYKAAKEGLPYEEPFEDQANIESSGDVKPEEPAIKPVIKPEDQPVRKPEEKARSKTEKSREIKQPAHQTNELFSPPPVYDSTTPKRSEMLPDKKSSLVIGAAIGAGILLIGLIYLIFFNKSNEIVVSEKPYDEVITESRQRYEKAPRAVPDSSQKAAISTDSLSLIIQTTDTSWIRLILDNSREEEFILFPNSKKSIKAADNFKITFGKSSAIKLQLNNNPLPFNPGSKTISHVLISSKGLEFLQNPPKIGQE